MSEEKSEYEASEPEWPDLTFPASAEGNAAVSIPHTHQEGVDCPACLVASVIAQGSQLQARVDQLESAQEGAQAAAVSSTGIFVYPKRQLVIDPSQPPGEYRIVINMPALQAADIAGQIVRQALGMYAQQVQVAKQIGQSRIDGAGILVQ